MAVRAAWTLQLPDSAPAPGSLEVALPTQDLAGLRAALEDARKQLNGAHPCHSSAPELTLRLGVLTAAKDAVGDREKELERAAALPESDDEDPEAP